MTALATYQRLECAGLWRDEGGGPRREVLVSFGDATLVIADPRTGRALAHWSLAAVERTNPRGSPAVFAPGPGGPEDLEIEDPDMIAALSRVRTAIDSSRPHPGRLRSVLLGAGVLAVVAAGLLWVPEAIVAQASRVVPDETRDQIGQMLMTDVFRVTGAACTAPEGRAALIRLGERLFGPEGGDLIVLGTGLAGTRHLPGGTVLIGRSLVENSPGPEALAGFVLAEAARMDRADPLRDLLTWTGSRAAFGLLTSGSLDPDRTVGYAEALLTRPEPMADPGLLAARFAAARTDPRPYIAAAGIEGATADELLARSAGAQPVMSDADWVALQGICAG